MKIRITRIVFPIIFLALAFLLSSPLLMRLFFISVILEFLGFVWAFSGARNMRVTFSRLPSHATVGDRLTESVIVENKSPLPALLLKFEGKSDMPGVVNTKDLNLKPKGTVSWSTTVDCSRRGRYSVGTGTLMAGDPLGFFSRYRIVGESRQLLVYPATVDLPNFEVSTSGILGDMSSGWLTGQTGTNAAGVREFVSGDSLMHIHWPSTARSGQLMVKMFDGGRASSNSEAVYVVVDLEKGVQHGETGSGSEEYSVKAAASLVKKYIEQGLQVGLIISSDPVVSYPPDRGDVHFYKLLEALATAQGNGTIPIDRVVNGHLKAIPGDATVVIVSPSASTFLVDSVRQLRTREILVSLVSVDPASFGGSESSSNIIRHMRWLGIQVYVATNGEDIGTSLDRRTLPSTVQFM